VDKLQWAVQVNWLIHANFWAFWGFWPAN